MKKYLTCIKSGRSCLYIGINTDNLKPVFIYADGGRDMGYRYTYIGAAARELEKYAAAWEKRGLTVTREYKTPAALPVAGCSEWNKQLYYYDYCGGVFPEMELYSNPIGYIKKHGRPPYFKKEAQK